MRIERLKLKNFRCYDALDIDFDPKLTVIVGENGKGKTAIFDALAIALEPYLRSFGTCGRQLSPKDVRRVPTYKRDRRHIDGMICHYPAEITLEGEAYGKRLSCKRSLLEGDVAVDDCEELCAYGRRLARAAADNTTELLPVLAYYGTQRIWVDSHLLTHFDKPLTQRSVGYEECLEPSSSYNTFGKWFEYVTKSAQTEQQYSAEVKRNLLLKNAIQKAVDTCLESTGLQDLYYNYRLKCFVVSHPDMGEMIVDELSDGFRSIISMVADLAYRMVRLNPQLGVEATLRTPGLVLIDEVDMHLHPLWQQTVLVDLQKAFPKVQFVVTTHSPQVLSSAPAESIRVLMWGKQFEGVRHVDFSLGANSNQLLQDIQNVSPRPQSLPIVQDLKHYLELVSEDRWDSEEALALRKKLDAWSHGREPALLRADMDIRLRQFRRRRS
jgi:predicted ATP-binding protein involved in virulence